jgi:hypothetical protein
MPCQNIFLSDKVEWLAVERLNKLIGAVGFTGDKAVAISAFYDDADGNMDGVVTRNEWLWSKLSFSYSGSRDRCGNAGPPQSDDRGSRPGL